MHRYTAEMIAVYSPRIEAIARFPEVPDVLAGARDRLALQGIHRPLHGLAVLALHAQYGGTDAEKPGEQVMDFLAHTSAFIGGNRSLDDLAQEGFTPGAHVHSRNFHQDPASGMSAAQKGVIFVEDHALTEMTVHYYTDRNPASQAMPVTAVAASFIVAKHSEIASAYVRLSGSAAGTDADPAYELRASMGFILHENIPVPVGATFENLALAGGKLAAFPMQYPESVSR